MSKHPPRPSAPTVSGRKVVPLGRSRRDSGVQDPSSRCSNLIQMVQAMVATIPGCDGGFTIEIHPIAAASQGPKGVGETRTLENADRRSDRVQANPAHQDELGRPISHAASWRPAGRALLSLKETAEVLRLGRATVYRHIRDGRIRVIRIGHRTLVPADVIESILESGLQG